MTAVEACCTCAALLTSIPPQYDEKTEKPAVHERRLECCGRAICARCMTDNPRFATYCPYCQVSSGPSPLPAGLRDPPSYSPPASPRSGSDASSPGREDLPPPYSQQRQEPPSSKKGNGKHETPDVLHFVDAANDSITSLSLRYGVPVHALRSKNGLYADHLLSARRTILIPGEYYKGGVSLSPRPIGGEEEEMRKSKVRKWMVACKVAEYEVALLYLKQADYDLEDAIKAYKEDEQWEKEHPLQGSSRGSSNGMQNPSRRNWGFGGGIASQLPRT